LQEFALQKSASHQSDSASLGQVNGVVSATGPEVGNPGGALTDDVEVVD
jgi:hypothetical protein